MSSAEGQCVEVWAKSSYSSHGTNCLEWRFRKSSRSESNGHCTEVALRHGTVQVRDSKDPSGPVLQFTPGEWAEFTTGIKERP